MTFWLLLSSFILNYSAHLRYHIASLPFCANLQYALLVLYLFCVGITFNHDNVIFFTNTTQKQPCV